MRRNGQFCRQPALNGLDVRTEDGWHPHSFLVRLVYPPMDDRLLAGQYVLAEPLRKRCRI